MAIAYIRLKPYDPAVGNVRERFRMGAACGWGDLMFIEGQLMELDPAAAKWLHENVRQVEGRAASPRAFDVWYTKEDCAKALHREHLAKLGRTSSVMPQHMAKPPKLESAAVSTLDEPPSTSAMEAEMLANQALAARIAEEPVATDFSDLAPSDDDLVANALAGASSADADPQSSRPPPPKVKASKMSSTRKPPKRTKRK
jgi:hypothetical protein